MVTGTRIPAASGEIAGALTVIDKDQIKSFQARNAAELLRHVPGMHIDQAGGRGSVSSVYVRGADPNYTVVMIDGVKVNDPVNSRGGSFDFSTLDADHIERIEIVRGPFSAVYGSDALAGAINILTRRGKEKSSVSLETEGGRSGFARALFQSSGLAGPLDYAFSASYLDNGGPVEGSAFAGKSAHANVGGRLSDAIGFRTVMRYAYSDSASFPDDSGGPLFAKLRDLDHKKTNELSLGFQVEGESAQHHESHLKLGVYRRDEDSSSPGVAPGARDPFGIPANSADNSFNRYDLTLNQLFKVSGASRVALGLETLFEEGSSRGEIQFGNAPVPATFDLRRKTVAPFVELRHAVLPGLDFHAGARLDVPEEFKSEPSPRLGISYALEKTHTILRANWGEGFKLPSFFALGNSIVGNPRLLPEKSRTIEEGMTQTFWDGRATLNAAFFQSRFSDAIDLEEGPPPRLVNRSKIAAEGVELDLHYDSRSDLTLNGHLTYVETDILDSPERLRNRPKWRGGFSVNWRFSPALEFTLTSLYIGKVFDSSVPTGDLFLAPYHRTDLAGKWTITPSWDLFLAIDNLFNARYEEFAGFPAPGIAPRLGMRWKL
ncbi:MAG: TonB-dependent receptor [Nitrospinae bacterium]|nr:TonB-dependent receptor [Nitrospinota bacterium]